MLETAGEKIKEGPFPQYPEGSDMPLVRPILEAKRALSRRSRIRIKNSDSDAAGFIRESNRPDALRRTRRELAEKIKDTPKKERRAIIEAAHARDEIAEEFMTNQQEVRVGMGDLGEQMARFVVLTPPEGRRTQDSDSKPPIFLISGISNDLESMGMLPQEIAFEGRKVVTIGYPESWHGNVTDAFGKAAEDSTSYEPYVSFFKEAIKAIREMPDVKEKLGDSSQIELWGWSAGALMTAEILEDPSFQEMVSNAVIIAPASCVDQKNIKMFDQEIPVPKAILTDTIRTFRDFENIAKLNVTERGKIKYTKDKRRRMTRAYNALRNKVLRRTEWWKNDIRVADGGNIIVVSYDKDELTKSYKVVDEIRQNPNLKVLELSGSHHTPKTKPEDLIDAISAVTHPLAA